MNYYESNIKHQLIGKFNAVNQQILKNFIFRILAAWALLVFVITLLPVVLLMWLIGFYDEPKRTKKFQGDI